MAKKYTNLQVKQLDGSSAIAKELFNEYGIGEDWCAQLNINSRCERFISGNGMITADKCPPNVKLTSKRHRLHNPNGWTNKLYSLIMVHPSDTVRVDVHNNEIVMSLRCLSFALDNGQLSLFDHLVAIAGILIKDDGGFAELCSYEERCYSLQTDGIQDVIIQLLDTGLENVSIPEVPEYTKKQIKAAFLGLLYASFSNSGKYRGVYGGTDSVKLIFKLAERSPDSISNGKNMSMLNKLLFYFSGTSFFDPCFEDFFQYFGNSIKDLAVKLGLPDGLAEFIDIGERKKQELTYPEKGILTKDKIKAFNLVFENTSINTLEAMLRYAENGFWDLQHLVEFCTQCKPDAQWSKHDAVVCRLLKNSVGYTAKETANAYNILSFSDVQDDKKWTIPEAMKIARDKALIVQGKTKNDVQLFEKLVNTKPEEALRFLRNSR